MHLFVLNNYMKTVLIKIGNSLAIIIPDRLIKQYTLTNIVVLDPTENGILIKRKARAGWKEQLKKAVTQRQIPDNELLEGFDDNIDQVF
jgi:antitoxin component of MazEF toxin-antitoxin module